MGGDLEGTGGTVPQSLRWEMAYTYVPPIYGKYVIHTAHYGCHVIDTSHVMGASEGVMSLCIRPSTLKKSTK